MDTGYNEKECIYYTKEGNCKQEEEREEYTPCCTCKDKFILKEGEKIHIKEEYTLKRVNGKIIKE